MTKQNKPNAAELLISDSYGIYIPKRFYEVFDVENWGLDPAKYTELKDPEGMGYWETWQEVLDTACFKIGDLKYTLWQSGDLWAICPDLMTNLEYFEFFGEKRL